MLIVRCANCKKKLGEKEGNGGTSDTYCVSCIRIMYPGLFSEEELAQMQADLDARFGT